MTTARAWAVGILAVANACQTPPRATEAPPATRAPTSAPVAAPTANASSSSREVVPVPPEPPACTRVMGRAPEAQRTLGRLAEAMADAEVTALKVAEIYGAVTPGRAFRTDLVIEEPFADGTKLSMRRTRVQNRQYITAMEVTFRPEVAPTIHDVVARLGGRPPTGAVRLRHSCSHGPCPTYRTTLRAGGIDLAATLAIHVEGVTLGGRLLAPFERSADPRAKRVRRLRIEPPYALCPVGEPLRGAERVTLREATTEGERLLVAGIEATAQAMAADAVDAAAIERALGVTMPRGEDRFGRLKLPIGLEPHATLLTPHLEVRWWANAMSDHSEVAIATDDTLPPLALEGLRYVDDPTRICRMYRDGEHLYEVARTPTGSHRVLVSLQVRHPVDDGPPHLDRVVVRREPRRAAR